VQAGLQIRRADRAKAQPDPDLARLDAEHAAQEIEKNESGNRADLESHRRQAHRAQLRDERARPERFFPEQAERVHYDQERGPDVCGDGAQSVA
jgi:hypothetical protein